jgi:hypothetical protein
VYRSGETQCSSSKLNVAVKSRGQNSLVIIDSDKNLEQDFEQINRSEDRSTQALNLDPYEGLDLLAAAMERAGCTTPKSGEHVPP